MLNPAMFSGAHRMRLPYLSLQSSFLPFWRHAAEKAIPGGGKGFTAVLIAWLANFNPPVMAGVSLFVTFLTSGTQYASSSLHLGSTDFASITVGLFFFFVIGSEFFIRYRIGLTGRGKRLLSRFGKAGADQGKGESVK